MTSPVDERHSAPAQARGRHGFGWAVAALVLAGIGGFAAWHYDAAPRAAAEQVLPPPPAVTVSTPIEREVTGWTSFTGQFSAVDQVDLRAQVSGYLTEIHFKDGQFVHKGDLLFVIDPRPFEIQLQQAVAQYQGATARLDLAERELQRAMALQKGDFASRELLDERVQAQRAAEASVEQAKAAIRSAQLNLDFSRITAPFSGRIGAHQVSIGSLVNGGSAAPSSTLLATVVSLNPIHLDFDMSETDYLAWSRYQQLRQSGVAVDRMVEASLSDEKGWARRGVLDFVDNQLDRSSGTIHARATLPNPDLLIAPGEFARLRVPTAPTRPMLLVPDAALVADQSNQLVMTVASDGTVVPKTVQTGSLIDGLRVITAGLIQSDRVIINGLMRASPGAKVTPQQSRIDLATSN